MSNGGGVEITSNGFTGAALIHSTGLQGLLKTVSNWVM
jgi:hypothetical protein